MQDENAAEWFLEFLPVAAVWTRDGSAVDCNEAAVRLLGVPRQSPTLDAWAHTLGPAGDVVVSGHLREALEGRSIARTRLEVPRARNSVLNVFVQSYPALFPDGHLGAVAIFEEPTRMEDDQRRIDGWLGALAHELSGTVQSIAMSVEMLKRDTAGDDAARRRLDSVERNTRVLRRLVTDYIDAARADEGNLRSRPEDVTLRPLLERIRDAQNAVDPEHHIELTGPADLVARVDETWLVQILRNLLSNAQKYSDPGIIELAAELRGDHLVLKLTDEGPGIPAELQQKLFVRFSRLPSAREGSGLGLWLSQYLARRMGGDLWVESEGANTTFLLAIPAAAAPTLGARSVCLDEEDSQTPPRGTTPVVHESAAQDQRA